MTIKQRIISFLQNHPEGIDDDELAKILELKQRQQVNVRCRELEKEGLITRRPVGGKIQNYWKGSGGDVPPVSTPKPQENDNGLKKWIWEGNIQSRVVGYLAAQGYHIRSVADTASHQQGIDIVAEKGTQSLWVSVKGYPQGTEKTNPSVQAGHWFRMAVFDIIEYRERDKEVSLAIALPDFPRYHSLARKITWFKPIANFSYFWVRKDGTVIIE